MTVRELKQALEGLPDEAHIIIANDWEKPGKLEINRVAKDWTGAVCIYNGEPCDCLFRIAKTAADI